MSAKDDFRDRVRARIEQMNLDETLGSLAEDAERVSEIQGHRRVLESYLDRLEHVPDSAWEELREAIEDGLAELAECVRVHTGRR